MQTNTIHCALYPRSAFPSDRRVAGVDIPVVEERALKARPMIFRAEEIDIPMEITSCLAITQPRSKVEFQSRLHLSFRLRAGDLSKRRCSQSAAKRCEQGVFVTLNTSARNSR